VYKNILVPVDDQEQSYAAVKVAGMIASCSKASVTLFHVRKPPEDVVTDMFTKDKLFELPLIEQERGIFAKCKKILAGFGIEPAVKVLESQNAASEIIRECGSGKYDVIVIGSRGRKALKQLMLGSVAMGVLGEAPCPVIMVHVPKGEKG
jgi:nucleotide-binding universal stress UspA family protein